MNSNDVDISHLPIHQFQLKVIGACDENKGVLAVQEYHLHFINGIKKCLEFSYALYLLPNT